MITFAIMRLSDTHTHTHRQSINKHILCNLDVGGEDGREAEDVYLGD